MADTNSCNSRTQLDKTHLRNAAVQKDPDGKRGDIGDRGVFRRRVDNIWILLWNPGGRMVMVEPHTFIPRTKAETEFKASLV